MALFVGARSTVPPTLLIHGKMEVKASGGIKDKETALQMLEHGATRLGTSSGVSIMEGTTSNSSY